MSGPAHRYGGPWTEIKLDAVVYYLECYSRALTQVQFFDLWYVDAFAGTGDRTVEREVGGLLEGRPVEVVEETIAGSARRALGVAPPFKHFVFIEQDPERCAALRVLAAEHPDRGIEVRPGDANLVLRKMMSAEPWSVGKKSRARGVIFLDPYALQVEWATLQAIAATTLCDVWYLFPLRDVVRQLAASRDGIGPKEPKLDRVLGPEWRDLYSLPIEVPKDLLGDSDRTEKRNSTKRQIEQWFTGRLRNVFGYVSEPLPILTPAGTHNFSLFLCVSSRRAPAIKLAEYFVRNVKRKFGPQASRRRSFP